MYAAVLMSIFLTCTSAMLVARYKKYFINSIVGTSRSGRATLSGVSPVADLEHQLGGGGGCIIIYPGFARLISFEINLISKEISRPASPEYMNMHPPPHINTLDQPLYFPTDWLQAKNTFTEMNVMFTVLKTEHSHDRIPKTDAYKI